VSFPTHRAYLSLGSNVDPEYHLVAATAMLAEYGRLSRTSTVWETTPIGFADQPRFLNAAVLLRTELPAARLIEEVIPRIEHALGRVRNPDNPNGPRTIDIDLALYNHEIAVIGNHQIPDPDILTRAFLATTLSELDAEYVHPIARQKLADIANGLIQQNWSGSMVRRDDVQLR
jgi:2-amino-4-hydroxy-6-hydroxymethyldihydropteridine diphosphokinase